MFLSVVEAVGVTLAGRTTRDVDLMERALPASPGWTIPVIGALLVAGDRHRVADVAEQGVPDGR